MLMTIKEGRTNNQSVRYRIAPAPVEAERYAVDYVCSWADERAKKYREPQRAGTPKGEPVGLSRKKLRMAQLFVLYPHLKIKKIAELGGVSESVLRVWRTQRAFKDAIAEARWDQTTSLKNAIKRHVEGFRSSKSHDEQEGHRQQVVAIMRILPFLNREDIGKPLAEFLAREYAKQYDDQMMDLIFLPLSNLDEKDPLKNPEVLALQYEQLLRRLDELMSKEFWEKRDLGECFKELHKELKSIKEAYNLLTTRTLRVISQLKEK